MKPYTDLLFLLYSFQSVGPPRSNNTETSLSTTSNAGKNMQNIKEQLISKVELQI